MTPLTGYLLIGALMAAVVCVYGVRSHRAGEPIDPPTAVTVLLLVLLGWPLFVLLCFVCFVLEVRRRSMP